MKSLLFLVCLLVRFTLAFTIQYAPTHLGWFPLGLIPIFIGLGFISRMLNLCTDNDTYNYEPGVLGFFRGPINDRGFFGGRVWWASYRLLHASLYIAAGFSLHYHGPHTAAMILGVDVGFAAVFGFWEWLFPTVRTARPSPLPTAAP